MKSVRALLCHQIAGNGENDLGSGSLVNSKWGPVLIDIDDLHEFHTCMLAWMVEKN